VPEFVHTVHESAHASAPASPLLDLEEVAVCELCGLVCREPVPPACPACGGGFG